MRRITILTMTLLFGIIYGQNRSTIFYTGPADSTLGHFIFNSDSGSYSLAERFTANNDFVMAAFSIYLGLGSDDATAIIEFREDENNLPGEIIFERFIDLDPNFPDGLEYTMTVNTECAHLLPGSSYWLTVLAASGSAFTWLYPESYIAQLSNSPDLGNNWNESYSDLAGAAHIWADPILHPEGFFPGDINGDFIYDVMDIVQIVDIIINEVDLTPEEIGQIDITGDFNVDILDIVQIVGIILNGPGSPMPDFALEDINDNSPTFGEMVGPFLYQGQVSCYYFGKAG